MLEPSAEALLDMWESGLRHGPVERSLRMLNVVYPEQEIQNLAQLSIGERDARLLRLREVLFGPRIASTTQCPRCCEQLEWESDVADLSVNEGGPSTAEIFVEEEFCRIKFRLPNSLDLAALTRDRDVGADSRKQLLERCLLEASTAEGESLRREQVPEAAWQAMVREMERADPQSNVEINLACPACRHSWVGVFDIISFLWAEINHWAERTFRAVHLLASSYGWREEEILAMSPTRRQIYLEMAVQ